MPDPTPDRKSVFGRAIELPAAERPAYLDAACAGHPALRAKVEDLLRAHGGAGSFLNASANSAATRAGCTTSSSATTPGRW